MWQILEYWTLKEYEFQIPLLGPNYSNSQIVQIIRDNTGLQQVEAHHGLDPTMVVELIFVDPLSLILGNVLCTTKKTTSPLIN